MLDSPSPWHRRTRLLPERALISCKYEPLDKCKMAAYPLPSVRRQCNYLGVWLH